MANTKPAGKSGYRYLVEYDRRIIYLLIFILVLAPLLQPFILPIQVSPDTQTYYNVLNGLKKDDKVLVVFDTEFSGYMEIQSGIIASIRMMFQHEVKVAIAVAHVEATGIPQLVFDQLAGVMQEHNYVYGVNYINLGYIFPNEAAVAASAQDFHTVVRQDAYGKSIDGTFLDDVKDWSSWTLLSDYTTGIQSTALINHYGLKGTPMIANVIGVMISTSMPYVSSGIYKALLGSMRGGAELEYLTGYPGPGLTAMNSFTLGHYMLMIAIVLGNVGYFGYRSYQNKMKAQEVK
jgi:hypothetical protein